LRIDEINVHAEIPPNHTQRLDEIRIIRYDDRFGVLALCSVPDEVRGEVHVGTFLVARRSTS